IVFLSTRIPGGFYSKLSNGAGEDELLLQRDAGFGAPRDWSNDGSFVLYSNIDPKTRRDLWVLDMNAHKSTGLLQSEFNEISSNICPEGQGPPRYVAYVSDEFGRNEVYVTTFPDPKVGKWPISNGGASQPRWRRDGKELLYLSSDGKLMSVDITTSPSFKASAPKVLFQTPLSAGSAEAYRWDLTPDGQKFLINTPVSDLSSPIAVVVNWHTALKK